MWAARKAQSQLPTSAGWDHSYQLLFVLPLSFPCFPARCVTRTRGKRQGQPYLQADCRHTRYPSPGSEGSWRVWGFWHPPANSLRTARLGGETEAGGHSEQSPGCIVTHNIGLSRKKRERRRGGNGEKSPGNTARACKNLETQSSDGTRALVSQACSQGLWSSLSPSHALCVCSSRKMLGPNCEQGIQWAVLLGGYSQGFGPWVEDDERCKGIPPTGHSTGSFSESADTHGEPYAPNPLSVVPGVRLHPKTWEQLTFGVSQTPCSAVSVRAPFGGDILMHQPKVMSSAQSRTTAMDVTW